jgi:outer membrane murein-binding lipoprotein Lpp
MWKATRDEEFKTEWKQIWSQIAQQDGGKLSLTTILGITGLVLGGVGIAAGGSAIGLPLAILLAPVGYLAGAEIDDLGFVKKALEFFRGQSHTPPTQPTPTIEPETRGSDHQPETSPNDIAEMVTLLTLIEKRCEQAEKTTGLTAASLEDLRRDLLSSGQTNESVAELTRRMDALAISVGLFRQLGEDAKQESAKQHERVDQFETKISAFDDGLVSLNSKLANLNSSVLECRSQINALKLKTSELETKAASSGRELEILKRRLKYGVIVCSGVLVATIGGLFWLWKR